MNRLQLSTLALIMVSVAQAQQPAEPPEAIISADFPYESRYVEVLGSTMHYIE